MKQTDIQKVSIRLISRIDGETMDHSYSGEYCYNDGSHCVVYTDHMGNAITKVGIELTEKAMLLHRVGYITADMLFDPSGETVVKYDAVSLKSDFMLQTHSYRIDEDDVSLNIHIEYSLHDGSDEPAIQAAQDIAVSMMSEERD